MKRPLLTIAAAQRLLRLGARQGYAAAAVIFLAATAIAHLAQPVIPEALFICHLTAIVLAALMAGTYAGLGAAAGGGLVIWYWLYPVGRAEDAIALALYIDAAALLLWGLDRVNKAFARLLDDRDRARLLFREAQHRTANNLMFISAFLRGELRKAESDREQAAQSLEEAMRRLEIFSQIHRQLSSHANGAETLIEASGARDVRLTMEIEPVELSFEQTMSLSLLLTEIVTNSLKHAFVERHGGRISIRMISVDDQHVLEVRDDGGGIASSVPVEAGDGKGYRILKALAAQLDGKLTVWNDEGLRTRLSFPRQQDARPLGARHTGYAAARALTGESI
jgi:two-component sensor histidine kinase